MPLRVHCPSGCAFRLPANRSGKTVRCPICKSVIRLAEVSPTELASGKPIPIRAVLVAPTRVAQDSVRAAEVLQEGEAPRVASAARYPAGRRVRRSLVDMRKGRGKRGLFGTRRKHGTTTRGREPDQTHRDDPLEVAISHHAAAVPEKVTALPLGDRSVDKQPVIGDDVLIQIDRSPDSRETDRRFLARFYAGCVAVLGLVSFVPSILLLVQWNEIDDAFVLPRWMYLLIFVGALHLVYALYLIQIPDWSSLWATSILSLAVATLYGFVAAGMWLDDGQGRIVQFLQLPGVLMRSAIIWCSLMLSLTALAAFLLGRDAISWRRAQRLLRESVVAR